MSPDYQPRVEEITEAEAPVGIADKMVPDYNPLELPEDHPKRKKLREGFVLFRSEYLGLTVPMDPPRDKIENGHRLRINGPGHVIKFERGEFWADTNKKIEIYTRSGVKREMTEVEFLRDCIKYSPRMRITEVKIEEMTVQGQRYDREKDRVAALNEMEVSEIRNLFSPDEITQHGLERARKADLILKAVLLGKHVPEADGKPAEPVSY